MTLWNLTDHAAGAELDNAPLHHVLRHLYWVATCADAEMIVDDANDTQVEVANIVAALIVGDQDAITRTAGYIDLTIEPA